MLTRDQTITAIQDLDTMHVVVDPADVGAAHDLLRWDCFEWWLPRLGPTSTLIYVTILRSWNSRPSTDTVLELDVTSFAPLLGVSIETLRRNLGRLARFEIATLDDAGFVHVPRFLPRLPRHELVRRSDDYVQAYEQYVNWCAPS